MKMEKPNFTNRDGLKLPIGYRFLPTDEELVLHYLNKKVLSIPFPAFVIPEFDVFQSHPSHLPGDWREKRYFFHKQKSSCGNGSGLFCRWKRVKASDLSGYWKRVDKRKHILAADQSGQATGFRITFVFYQNNHHSPATTTPWFMHQYHLISNSTQTLLMEKEDWVIARLYQKKRNGKKEEGGDSQQYNYTKVKSDERKEMMSSPICCVDFNVENISQYSAPSSPSSTTSCLSGITVISDTDQLHI